MLRIIVKAVVASVLIQIAGIAAAQDVENQLLDTPAVILAQSSRDLTRADRDVFVIAHERVSESGEVADVAIVASYPPGLGDSIALREARAHHYKPAMKSGVPVVSTAVFSLEHVGRPTEAYELQAKNRAKFEALFKAVASNDTVAARGSLNSLRENFDRGDLNLLELAYYYALLAPVQRAEGRFAEAMQSAENAPGVDYLDKRWVRMTRAEVILNELALNQRKLALKAYDNFNKDEPLPESLARLMERVRADTLTTRIAFDSTTNIEHVVSEAVKR